ncbi:DUF2163 domain-containing protein [Paraburkholderia pallida]|nr:DUF2163 domain-containing protein [Paraburkholderia pallida]
MKNSDPAFKTWLDSNPPMVRHGLTEFHTAAGQSYFYTDGDVDTVWNGQVYTADGPLIERDSITRKLGIEVAEARLTIWARPADQVGYLSFVRAVKSGLLDDALVIIRDALFAIGEYAPRGTVHLFEGKAGEMEAGRFSVDMQVLSYLHQLNTRIPRGRFQPQCLRTLYDHGCGVDRAAWTRSLVAVAGSTRLSVRSTLDAPDNQFASGTLTGASGTNTGAARTVRSSASGVFELMTAMPADVSPGEVFTACPGCNRSMERCRSFNNSARFRGTPFVPQPEATV